VRRVLLSGAALVAFGFGAVSCGSGGPSAHCADWDTHRVTTIVTPGPKKVYKRVYDSSKRKYVHKWVNGSTPAPYQTTTTSRHCDEWVTESPTPNNS
jgi:hypothetical protein